MQLPTLLSACSHQHLREHLPIDVAWHPLYLAFSHPAATLRKPDRSQSGSRVDSRQTHPRQNDKLRAAVTLGVPGQNRRSFSCHVAVSKSKPMPHIHGTSSSCLEHMWPSISAARDAPPFAPQRPRCQGSLQAGGILAGNDETEAQGSPRFPRVRQRHASRKPEERLAEPNFPERCLTRHTPSESAPTAYGDGCFQ